MVDYFVEEGDNLFNLCEAVGKIICPPSSSRGHEPQIPVDILDTPNKVIFYVDLPGLSKSDIQVTVEDDNILVIRSSGKRKRREDGDEEEECKYLRLERRPPQKLVRKFKLPDNCNVSAISAKSENGVITLVVDKLPPPKPKSLSIPIS